MFIKVAPIDNPGKVREVSVNSWKHWPAADGVPGGKMGGKDIYKEVTEEQVIRAREPKEPTVPPEVQRIMAGEKAIEVPEAEPQPAPQVNKGGRPRSK